MSKISLAMLLKSRDRIRQCPALLAIVDEVLDGDYFNECVIAFVEALPPKVSPQAVRASLYPLAGQVFSEAVLQEYSWRLAANVSRLRDGQAVLSWTSQTEKEWVPVCFIDAKRSVNHKDQWGYSYGLRIMGGSPAPMEIRKFYTSRSAAILAGELGFSSRGPLTYKDDRELVGTYCLVELDPEYSRRGRPSFYHIRVPSVLLKYNRELIRCRLRTPGVFDCPKDYTHYCFECEVGYRECPCGVHRSTYVARPCPHCKRPGWFDPDREENECVDCLSKKPYYFRP
jgi:hypothetical protein